MPTMGRVIGAILFGALAWYASTLIVPLFPVGAPMGWFQEINTICGLVVGWEIAGARADTGYVAEFSYGLTALVAMVVMALFSNSFGMMIKRSLRKLYDGPGEAVTDVFALFIEHGTMILTREILATLLIGGFAGGLITEFFGRRFS
jgi:hypothetical protein